MSMLNTNASAHRQHAMHHIATSNQGKIITLHGTSALLPLLEPDWAIPRIMCKPGVRSPPSATITTQQHRSTKGCLESLPCQCFAMLCVGALQRRLGLL